MKHDCMPTKVAKWKCKPKPKKPENRKFGQWSRASGTVIHATGNAE